MKHITIGEINKFQCVGSQCLYSCCLGGWDIMVDNDTAQYYQTVEGPFGEKLRQDIDYSENPPRMKLQEGRCPFLNEEKLCRVYIELGPEHMCDTCKIYPRYETVTGDIVFHYLTISCPEVGRIFLSRKAPMKMTVLEKNAFRKRGLPESPDWRYFRIAERAFHANMAILQNRSYRVAERERAFLLFNRSLQAALDANDMTQAETLIEYFSSSENYAPFVQSKLSAQLPSKVRLFRELCELFLTRDSRSAVPLMFVDCLQYIRSENADIGALSDALKAFDDEQFQREQEHLLAYFLFNHYLSDSLLDKSAERSLFGQAVFILTVFQFYRIFTAIFSVLEKGIVDLKTRSLIISHLSRYFEHSQDDFLETFVALLEERQFYDMGFLFQLIS